MRPVERVSMIYDVAWGPLVVTFWGADGTGLQIGSEMHDVAFREEVGVLTFTLVDSLWGEERVIDVPPFQVSGTYKLTTVEANGAVAESGLELGLSNGETIIIVASSGPCHIAISGLVEMPLIFQPEYPIAHYTRTRLS